MVDAVHLPQAAVPDPPELTFTARGLQPDSAMATAIATTSCGSRPSEVATVRVKE